MCDGSRTNWLAGQICRTRHNVEVLRAAYGLAPLTCAAGCLPLAQSADREHRADVK